MKELGKLSIEKKRVRKAYLYYLKNHTIIYSQCKTNKKKNTTNKGKEEREITLNCIIQENAVNILMNLLLDSSLRICTHTLYIQFYMKDIKLIFSSSTLHDTQVSCQLGHHI